MSSPNQRLDLLRRDIDAIDAALHELIVKRGTIVEDIRKIKTAQGPALRPGREAAVMRRLASQHRGAFPLRALISIWREMMAGFTLMQQPLSVGVCGAAPGESLFALARDHYGGLTPLVALPSASAGIRAVADGTVDLAVLPMPCDGEVESWWLPLMGGGAADPRIVSRLPFVSDGKGDQALVVARFERDPSGDDSSVLAVHLGERASRGRMQDSIAASGFAGAVALASREISPSSCFHIFAVGGEVAADDPRLAALAAEIGPAFLHARPLGGYANPLVLPPS
jgi:chorismate mutase